MPMNLIDTHIHLQFPEFDADRQAVLERARRAGVEAVISLATDPASARRCVELAAEHHEVYAAVGIHPSEAHRAGKAAAAQIRRLATPENKVVAIGEIGLDFYWDKTHFREQYAVFGEMLRLAQELSLPVVIHNREAQREMQWFFQEEGWENLNGVMHCFAGDELDARFYLEMGLHISFTANITYPDFRGQEVIRAVPMERLLIETDSPYIAPRGRGKRNEPANVLLVAEKIAEIRHLTVAEVAAATTENARRLFGIS